MRFFFINAERYCYFPKRELLIFVKTVKGFMGCERFPEKEGNLLLNKNVYINKHVAPIQSRDLLRINPFEERPVIFNIFKASLRGEI